MISGADTVIRVKRYRTPGKVLMSHAVLMPTIALIRPWLRRLCWPAAARLDGWVDA